METNKVYHADCIKGMKELVDKNSVDIIVTSPPYNIGIKYNSHKDAMPFEEYLNWMEEFGKACALVLKENGSLFFNMGDKSSDEFKTFEVARRIAKSLQLQNTIHWIKSIAIPEIGVNTGHFKPVNSERFMNNCHEYIFHFTKSKSVSLNKTAIGVPYADKSNITRWKHTDGNDVRDRGNVWHIPYETVKAEKDHPAAFPKKLPEMCIKLHGFDKNTVVLDPFAGSGTTCVAAKELGCKFIGFEIDPKYVKIAKNNLSQRQLSIA